MKEVPKTKGRYFADESGEIYSKISGSLVKMKSYSRNGWYPILRLSVDGSIKMHRVHRIIAETFIPNPNNLRDVNHKNGIKTDNRVENLEWASRSENIKHSYKCLGRKPVTGEKHPKYKPIVDLQTGIFYASTKEAGIAKGFTRDQVKSGLRSKGKYYGLSY